MIGPLTEDSDWAIDYSSLDIHTDQLMDENDSLLDTKVMLLELHCTFETAGRGSILRLLIFDNMAGKFFN